MAAMSVTLGESLTIRVLEYAFRTAFTTDAAPSQVTPNAMPPDLTLGQEMLSSMAGMRSNSLILAAQAA